MFIGFPNNFLKESQWLDWKPQEFFMTLCLKKPLIVQAFYYDSPISPSATVQQYMFPPNCKIRLPSHQHPGKIFSMMWPGFATCAYLYYSLNITKNLLSIFLYQDVILYLIVYILLLFFYFHMKGCCDYSLAEILQNRRKFLNLNFFIPVLNVYAEEAKMWSSILQFSTQFL